MSYCPLSCSSHSYMPSCKGSNCELTEKAGNCRIKQALSQYVNGERTKRAEEAKSLDERPKWLLTIGNI